MFDRVMVTLLVAMAAGIFFDMLNGYPDGCLCGTLAESEERLRGVLERDPLCYKENRQTKGLQAGNESFDDRCYLRLRA